MKLGTQRVPNLFGAGDEARTRYLHLGKVALYRMSYTRKLATRNGLEPSTSSVTGWRANRLHHEAMWWWEQQGSNL